MDDSRPAPVGSAVGAVGKHPFDGGAPGEMGPVARQQVGHGRFGGDDGGRVGRPVRARPGRRVAAPFVHVGRGREMGGGPPETVGEIDAEGRLGRLGRDLLRRVALLEEAQQLLALLFVFGIQMDRVVVGGVAVHGIARADDVDFSEGDQGEDGVNEGGDGGEGEGGDGV